MCRKRTEATIDEQYTSFFLLSTVSVYRVVYRVPSEDQMKDEGGTEAVISADIVNLECPGM